MFDVIYEGTYLQVKTLAMLVDWFHNEQRLDFELDVEKQAVTCHFTSEADRQEVDEMWRDVCATMNTWVESAIALEHENKHK